MDGEASVLLALLPSAATITQVEVFEHKLAVTTGYWRIAGAARSLATDGLWSSFTPNHLIKSTAVRTGEETQTPGHDYASKTPFDLLSPGLHANELGPIARQVDKTGLTANAERAVWGLDLMGTATALGPVVNRNEPLAASNTALLLLRLGS